MYLRTEVERKRLYAKLIEEYHERITHNINPMYRFAFKLMQKSMLAEILKLNMEQNLIVSAFRNSEEIAIIRCHVYNNFVIVYDELNSSLLFANDHLIANQKFLKLLYHNLVMDYEDNIKHIYNFTEVTDTVMQFINKYKLNKKFIRDRFAIKFRAIPIDLVNKEYLNRTFLTKYLAIEPGFYNDFYIHMQISI